MSTFYELGAGQVLFVDDIKSSNPKQEYGDAKVPLQLVPPSMEMAVARGLGEGAKKYSPWNWRDTKVEYMTYVGAIKRHLAAFIEGEAADPDSISGKQHLDGAAASLAILIEAVTLGYGVDNRPCNKRCNHTVLQDLQDGSRKDMEITYCQGWYNTAPYGTATCEDKVDADGRCIDCGSMKKTEKEDG